MNKFKKNISDSAFLFLAMLMVNAGNYLINLGLGRFLGPAAFSEASIIATIVLIMSFIAVGIQLTVAKFTAVESEDKSRASLITWFQKGVYKVSIVFSLIFIILVPVFQKFLQFESSFSLYIIAIGFPLFFSLSIKRGWLQGTDQFLSLAFSYLLEMLLRMVFTIVLLMIVLKVFNYYSSEAVATGFLISFFATFLFRSEKSDLSISKLKKSKVLNFVAVIGIYELSQIIINNSDVIMAKHFFTAEEAGLYAAIALIGRVVYFGTWTIVTLLFPKVIQQERDGLPHHKLFWSALGLVVIISFCIVLVSYLAPELIISVLFGAEYLVLSEMLWLYALSTSLFACANVFAYYHLSLNNYLPVLFSLLAGFGQVILIAQFHQSLFQVILIQLCLMTTLLVVMTTYHLFINQSKLNKGLIVLSKLS